MRVKKALLCFFISLLLANPGEGQVRNRPTKTKLGYGFTPGFIAGRDFVAGQLIVGIREGMGIRRVRSMAKSLKGVVRKELSSALLLDFPSETDVTAAVIALVRHPDVAFVERNGFMSIPPEPTRPPLKGGKLRNGKSGPGVKTVSNDSGVGYQWHLTVIRKTANLGALSTTPPTIAVVDTGVDYSHPDLQGKVFLGKNSVANNFDPFDDNGHGTHVTGLAAAKAANGVYGEGVCHNCKILAVKVLGTDGFGTFFDVADGMHYAHTATTSPPVRVINMSLGGPNSLLVASEVDHIKAAGLVLVAAAGNDNTTDTTEAFPGADPDTALRVMATEWHDCRAEFSNFSPAATPYRYNIAAPGLDIFSTTPAAGYESFSGTSMASPLVAGAAALVLGQEPALTRDQLVTRLINNGQAISCGFAAATRRLDVRKALLRTAETAIVGQLVDPFTGVAPSPPLAATTASLFLGATQLATDFTNAAGSYEMAGLMAGSGRILKGSRVGYVTAPVRAGISVTAGVVAGPYSDALPKARPAGDVTITLDWKTTHPSSDTPGCIDACNGWEFDLLMKLPSGNYIDPFSNTGDLLSAPFVKNPRDSFADSQPLETVVIRSAAANGVYRVVVDKFPFGADFFNPNWVGSQGSVQMYNGATALGPFFGGVPLSCATERYWHLGDLTKNGTAYTFSTVNACTDTLP